MVDHQVIERRFLLRTRPAVDLHKRQTRLRPSRDFARRAHRVHRGTTTSAKFVEHDFFFYRWARLMADWISAASQGGIGTPWSRAWAKRRSSQGLGCRSLLSLGCSPVFKFCGAGSAAAAADEVPQQVWPVWRGVCWRCGGSEWEPAAGPILGRWAARVSVGGGCGGDDSGGGADSPRGWGVLPS